MKQNNNFASVQYEKHIPTFPLSNYVDSIAYIEGNNKGAGLPKTNMSMVFNLNDNFKLFEDNGFKKFTNYKKHWVAGLQTKPTFVESYGISKMVVIQFKITGAFIFLTEPLHYFTDQYIPLDAIFNKDADVVWEQMKKAKSLNEIILIAENFLYRKLLTTKIPNEKLLNAVNYLLQTKQPISINDICSHFNISRKHLNHLFQDNLGVSPKTLSSLHRFQNVLQSMSKAKPDKLTEVAYRFEYYDQAHFNNTFKQFSGLKPTEYSKLVEANSSLKVVPHFLPKN